MINMSIFAKIKRHRLIRGLYFLYRDYFGDMKRSRFGYIADDVTLMPPLRISNPENVFLYGDNGLRNADIMTTNAKFIMKPHSGAAEGLRVTTGNHAMIKGRFYRTITESEKPKGLDKDGTKFVIAQVNTVSIEDVLKNKEQIENAMNKFMQDNTIDLFVFMITDIIENNSQILVLGKQEIAEKAFNIKLENNTAFLKGVVSRKKQVVPNIDNAIV